MDSLVQQLKDARESLRQALVESDAQCQLLHENLKKSNEEVARLKSGKFTSDELQGICHNLSVEDECAFKAGCENYQAVLFGKGSLKQEREAVARLVKDYTELTLLVENQQGEADLTDVIRDKMGEHFQHRKSLIKAVAESFDKILKMEREECLKIVRQVGQEADDKGRYHYQAPSESMYMITSRIEARSNR